MPCSTEWCDTSHILSHITARHLITRSRAAKFQTNTLNVWYSAKQTARAAWWVLGFVRLISQVRSRCGWRKVKYTAKVKLHSRSSRVNWCAFGILYICTQTQNDKKLRFALRAAQFGHGHRMVCTLSSKMLQTWTPLKPTHLLQVSSFPWHGLNLIPIEAFHQSFQRCTNFCEGAEDSWGTLKAEKSPIHGGKAPVRWVLSAGGLNLHI